MIHRLKWFLDRRGKIIYRKKLSCPCDSCQKTEVLIGDKYHAQYLYDCQCDLDIDYQDKPIKTK